MGFTWFYQIWLICFQGTLRHIRVATANPKRGRCWFFRSNVATRWGRRYFFSSVLGDFQQNWAFHHHWIGLREHLEETMVFAMKCCFFCNFSLTPMQWHQPKQYGRFLNIWIDFESTAIGFVHECWIVASGAQMAVLMQAMVVFEPQSSWIRSRFDPSYILTCFFPVSPHRFSVFFFLFRCVFTNLLAEDRSFSKFLRRRWLNWRRLRQMCKVSPASHHGDFGIPPMTQVEFEWELAREIMGIFCGYSSRHVGKDGDL